MNEYQLAKQRLEEAMCKKCHGSGEIDDAEPGDIYFKTWVCPDCKGTGFKRTG